MDKIPFWEEIYENRDINTFPTEPNGTILEFEHLLKKDSAILEAGCGEGQNVRYLAKNGYSDIDAFDLSEAGISKLKWLCEREGLRINAFVDDLTKYHFTKSYDLVMSLSGFPEVKWIYIRSFGIVDSPEYKELVVPTPLLIQPDRQGFSYANPADRNRSPNAELSNHNFKFFFPSLLKRG